MSATDLMKKLLDYGLEQAKTVDPKAFKLAGHAGFQKGYADLQGLPGVDFDVRRMATTSGSRRPGWKHIHHRHSRRSHC